MSSDFPMLFPNQPLIYSVIQSESTCVMLSRLVPILYCAAIIFTSFLFFLRTRAIFQRNPWIVAFFACLWVAVLGGCMAFVLDVLKQVQVNPALKTTSICFNAAISPFVAAATIIPLINDTFVFIAITWRLSCNSYDPYTFGSSIRILIFGDYLPVFSKVMLQNGQAYYLLAFPDLCLMLKWLTICFFHRTIVTMHIISVIMLYASYSNIFRTVFAVPNTALMNVMACRVFRNTILFESRGEARTDISSLQFL